MKKLYLLIGVLVLIGLAFWFESKTKVSNNSPTTLNNLPLSQRTGLTNTTSHIKQRPQPRSISASEPNGSGAIMEYIRNIKADPEYDWKQPINFWGRVVDESNNPVVNANAHFQWTDLSSNGTSQANVKSDGNGFFSLTGQHGKRLVVTVDTDGYYSSGNSRGAAFEYANPADGLFTPDPNNPVTFVLRKKGVGVDLITSQHGMKQDLHVVPPSNGSPVLIDFFDHKIGNDGQLKIEGWKGSKDFKTAQNNWGFRLTVSNGGLIQEHDEFPFEAPDTGYQSVIEWHFADGTSDWQGGINEKFYIKFGNPPRYGIITVKTTAFSPGVYLGYAINPTGSRNLEPK